MVRRDAELGPERLAVTFESRTPVIRDPVHDLQPAPADVVDEGVRRRQHRDMVMDLEAQRVIVPGVQVTALGRVQHDVGDELAGDQADVFCERAVIGEQAAERRSCRPWRAGIVGEFERDVGLCVVHAVRHASHIPLRAPR